MVKADVKHNYYADLLLPPNCSLDDIKKQYRKLALQYHPDRNAGKEEEYVPKFQAIQTAHEILGDPTTKDKYDSDRRRSGLNRNFRNDSQPTPGNPYKATSAYPPPQRRTAPGTWQRPPPSGPAPGPTGADRFSNFPRTAPTARKDPAQDRANMFRAWQNMNTPQDRQRQNSDAGRDSPAPRARPPPPPPPPRNDPRTPNYRPEPSRASQNQSAWEAMDQAFPGRPGGFQRTKSQRTPKRQGFDPSTPGSDERSASGNNYFHRRPSADAPSGNEDQGFSVHHPAPPYSRPAKPVKTPSRDSTQRSHDLNDEVPYTEANRIRTPYSNFSGERTTFSSEQLRRSASTRDTTRMNDTTATSRARSSSPAGSNRKPEKETKSKPFVNYKSSDDSEDETTDAPAGNFASRTGSKLSPKSFANRPIRKPTSRSAKLNNYIPDSARSATQNIDNTQSTTAAPDMQQKSSTNIFSIPIGADTFVPTSNMNRSEENINTIFSPDGWNGTFKGTPDYFTQPSTATRKTSSPNIRSRQRSSRSGPTRTATREGSTADITSNQVDGSSRPPFDSGVPQSAHEIDLPNSRSASNETKSAGDGDPAGISHAGQTYAQASVGDEDAMDVDSMPPQPTAPGAAPQPVGTKEARLYSVPPSQWRQQQGDAPSGIGPQGDPRSQGVDKSSVDASLKTNLQDLGNVEPFVPNTNGLHNFSEILSTLPFQSQPSTVPPTSSTEAPPSPKLPDMPVAPTPPSRLTKESWQLHARAFSAYLLAFHIFNETMLRHFCLQEEQTRAILAEGTGWVEAVGEATAGPGGFRSYLRANQEQQRAREVWNVACEHHDEAVGTFDRLRERMRVLATTVGIAEH